MSNAIYFPHDCLDVIDTGYSEGLSSSIKIQSLDRGLVTRRIRECSSIKIITLTVLACDKNAYLKFCAFYNKDTGGGAKWFYFRDWCKEDAYIRARFTTDGITMRPVDKGCLDRWEISFSLETKKYVE